MDFLLEVLTGVFSRDDVTERYIRDFMELQVLDMNKVDFINEHGSKSAKMKLIDYVLSR